MERTLEGYCASALSWVVHHGSRIVAHWTYRIGMPAEELADRVAQTLAQQKVGDSPESVSPEQEWRDFTKHPAAQAWDQAWRGETAAVHGQLASLMRCVYGNPFRPVTLDPSWLTATVTCLAQAIYADRAFDRLPILADALEDAGCTNQDILAHCRSGGEHVRGCWVVDLLLAKT
jgi:hypothetical protein